MHITRLSLYLTVPDATTWRWSDEKPEQQMGSIFVRLFTDEGIEGIAGITTYNAHHIDKSIAEAIISLSTTIIGKDPLQREKLWSELKKGYVQLHPAALSAIDIALWDISGKVANLPIYQLLGGYQDRVPAYASTPTFPTLEEYIAFVEEMQALGFTACKFHVWGDPQRDIQLIRGITKRFGTSMNFMFDAEGTYDHDTALRVGRVLDEASWEWYEMPFSDYDWTGYRHLCDALTIPVIPGGFSLHDLGQYAEAFRQNVWDRARVDAGLIGGLTLAHKVATLAEAAGKRVEVECFGFTLNQIANLHLILSKSNCHLFEMPVPYGPFDAYMLEPLRADANGYVHAPAGPGLGVSVDWQAVQRDAVAVWQHP